MRVVSVCEPGQHRLHQVVVDFVRIGERQRLPRPLRVVCRSVGSTSGACPGHATQSPCYLRDAKPRPSSNYVPNRSRWLQHTASQHIITVSDIIETRQQLLTSPTQAFTSTSTSLVYGKPSRAHPNPFTATTNNFPDSADLSLIPSSPIFPWLLDPSPIPSPNTLPFPIPPMGPRPVHRHRPPHPPAYRRDSMLMGSVSSRLLFGGSSCLPLRSSSRLQSTARPLLSSSEVSRSRSRRACAEFSSSANPLNSIASSRKNCVTGNVLPAGERSDIS